jgi:hypothetical protein
VKIEGMSAAAAKRTSKGAKPETTRSPAQLKGLEKARAARKAKLASSTEGAGAVVETPARDVASEVESLIELFAERWNKIGSQADADRLHAEIEHAAKTLSPQELLTYAAAPSLRGRLLSVCVFARAQERAAGPRGGASDDRADLPRALGLRSSSGTGQG